MSVQRRLALSFAILPALAVSGIVGLAYAQESSVKLDVIYVPTPPEVVARMLDMVNVTKDDYVIDLGSGDGRIAIAAAKRGARAFGVDIDPKRVAEARANAAKEGVADRATFEVRNLFEQKISDASVMTMYLLQTINLKLRPRILNELKPGSRVVSHAFDMEGWKPDQRDTVDGRNVYMWVVPAKVEGRWQAESGEHKFTLDIKQSFQNIGGSATANGRSAELRGGLQGDMIEFTADLGNGPTQYRGRVNGGVIEGQNWRATRS